MLKLNCQFFLVAAEEVSCFSVVCGTCNGTWISVSSVLQISHISMMQSKTVAAPMMSVHLPVPPGVWWKNQLSSLPASWSLCMCIHEDHQLLRRPVGSLCGNGRRESHKPLYPEPLRLRADGQTHTRRWLGHQRLSVGWAANEVWREWPV